MPTKESMCRIRMHRNGNNPNEPADINDLVIESMNIH